MQIVSAATDSHRETRAAIADRGFAFVDGARTREWLLRAGSLDDWPVFANSWNDLRLDGHMADGGRYRRRRHAVFAAGGDGRIVHQPHQPHWQELAYNPLNGGVARWFEPVAESIAASASLDTILRAGRDLFAALAPDAPGWRIELHQFRIEASPEGAGLPTPEGSHRDGVDYVLVLMIRRENIASGTTSIHDDRGSELGSFTLTHPFDAALVDDNRVWHGVTAVEAIDPSLPAYRDVLVVTFRRAQATGWNALR